MRKHSVGGRVAELDRLSALAVETLDAMDQEISRGRSSGKEIRNDLASMIREVQDLIGGRPLTVRCSRQHSPATWVAAILDAAAFRSCGVVEKYLVGATLQQRHPGIAIPNNPGATAGLGYTLRVGLGHKGRPSKVARILLSRRRRRHVGAKDRRNGNR